MKKSFIFLLFISAFIKAWGQTPAFHVQFSEPLAVYEFVDNLSANAPKNAFKRLFDTSEYNNEKYKALIATYDSLQLDYSYEYTSYPFGQKIGGSTISLLKKTLINSHSIDDFKMNAIGIIPNKDLMELSAILKEFAPVYQKLVYQPNKKVFEAQLNELKKLVVSKNIPSYFKAGLTFYNSSWDSTVPFEVVFYPLSNSKGFTATALYNISISGLPTSRKDYNVLLSVMMHEIFHILYDEEALSLKKDIDTWVKENPSKNSRYAFLLMNEALATALGNGYVFGKMTGKEDTGNWYNRKYTNLMAKKIYPMVKEYIEQQKPIDKAFIDNYIKLYDDNFSGWLMETDNIMTDRYLISENEDDFHALNQKYPYRSYSSYEDELSASALDKMKQTPITKIIVISKDNKNELQLVKQTFKELSNWTPDYQADFTYYTFLDDKTYLIIINSVKKTGREQIEQWKL